MRSLANSQAFAAPFPVASQENSPAASIDDDSREWSISDMARHFGLTLRTLRFYEARGLIAPNRFGGARYYTRRDRTRLKLVLAAKQMGFTLTETAAMIGKAGDGEPGDLPLSTNAVQSQIDFLEHQRSAIETALQSLRSRLGQMSAP